MLRLPPPGAAVPPIPGGAPRLPYEAPALGVNYWLHDDVLSDPDAVVARCRARPKWELGFPHAKETWPGMRFHGALAPEELTPIEAWVRSVTGKPRLWIETAPG